jgi:hypothetical protein
VHDKIRNSFAWLELVWADSGYDAHQVNTAVAKVPSLRIEIVKRSDDMKGFVLLPAVGWLKERSHGSDATDASPKTGKTSLRPCKPSSFWRRSRSQSGGSRDGCLLSQVLRG